MVVQHLTAMRKVALGLGFRSVAAALLVLAAAPVGASEAIFSADFELGTAGSWSDALGSPDILTLTLPGNLPLVMVRIPAGVFLMGSPGGPGCDPNPATCERSRSSDETLHQVTLTADHYLARYETSQAQWTAVTSSAPVLDCGGVVYGEGDDYPAYCVSWEDVAGAGGFIEQLNAHLASSRQLGSSLFRLPTEAEWEHAARAGAQTRFSHGDVLECDDFGCGACPSHLPWVWWCGDPAAVASEPVGAKRANGYGLHDVHGNVFEWVADWYGAYPEGPVVDPDGPLGPAAMRVSRGGAWSADAAFCRSASRYADVPNSRWPYLGFRLAMSLPEGGRP